MVIIRTTSKVILLKPSDSLQRELGLSDDDMDDLLLEATPHIARPTSSATCSDHRKESSHMPTASTGAASANDAQPGLWNRNYLFTIAVNLLVYSVHFLLMLWSTAYAMEHFGASISLAGLASGLFIVGALVARIPAGRFIDFVGRRHMFLAGSSLFFLLILAYLAAPTLAIFMVVRFVHGVSFGMTSTAASTIVAALIPLAQMGTGIGYFTLGVTIASAVGPFLAMNLTAAHAYVLGIEITAGAAFVIFLLSFLIKAPEREILPQEKADLKRVSFDRFFAVKSLAISFIALMGGVCYSTVLSFLGAYTTSIGVTGIGATCFFLCFALTSFISRPLTGYLLDNYGGNVVIYPSLLSMAVAMVIIANAASDVPMLIGALFLGFGYGTVTASCHALAVHCAPMHQVGVATSTYFVLLDFGIGVGPYTLGSFVPAFGFSIVYLLAGALAVIGMGLYYVLIGRYGRFTRHQMDRTAEAKEIIAQRRQHFYQEAVAAGR